MQPFRLPIVFTACGFLLSLSCSPLLKAGEGPVVAAAASVKFALQDIAEAFRQDTGKTVRISYASSGNLTRQIQHGGPFELFISANANYVERLYNSGRTLDQGVIYALGRVALLTSKRSPLQLDAHLMGVKDALQAGRLKRFAIANPEHAPYGAAAREILQRLGLWESIQPHLVMGENVAQAGQFASSGAAQVGLVSYSLALAPVLQKTARSFPIPGVFHRPLEQTMVLLRNAGDSAKAFYGYLQQNTARTILARYGYTLPQEPVRKPIE